MKKLQSRFRTVFYFVAVIIISNSSCNNSKTNSFEEDQPTNANVENPDVQVLMHNPSGIRIEYNITRQELELWISPQAGKDNDYWIRNFSNRDDHTRLFDKISFPGINFSDYEKVDYDPWHSVIHFKDQKMHIATVFGDPIVMLWFEKDELVDFKSNKQDSIIERSDNIFHMFHPDRNLDFSFVAKINGGHFKHQLQTDRGRSTYARAYLPSNKAMFIGGELFKEDVQELVNEISKNSPELLIQDTREKTNEIVDKGKIVLNDWDSLEQLIDFNKRIWVSSQDHSGALHASIKRIYYLIWVREGGLACPWIGYSGWIYPLENWIDFQMENPTEIHDEGPGGRFFGQLVNGKITKWQEDGAFYAIWTAFTHWTQTGSDEYVSGENLQLLRDAMGWLERYCFNEEKGLFWRQHYCETPLYNSRGFGWDNAVGKPVLGWDAPPYKGEKIEKTYDIYINILNYSVYRMLEAMCLHAGIENDYGRKAGILASNMKFMFEPENLPLYGKIFSVDGKEIISEEYGMDKTDYIWALTCPPFYPDYVDIYKYRNLLFDDLLEKKDHYFLAAYFSILGSLKMDQVKQKDVKWAIDYAAKECYIPWGNLPLAGSMVEMSGYYPPGHGHQIRPQMFTMGAWFGAMGNLAINRLPFGLAIQPGSLVKAVENYQYQGKNIQFSYQGKGRCCEYSVNGQAVKYSLQVPENMFPKENNEVKVQLSGDKKNTPLLTASTLELKKTEEDREEIKFHFKAYGNNILYLENINNKADATLILEQAPIALKTRVLESGLLTISFQGQGNAVLSIKK